MSGILLDAISEQIRGMQTVTKLLTQRLAKVSHLSCSILMGDQPTSRVCKQPDTEPVHLHSLVILVTGKREAQSAVAACPVIGSGATGDNHMAGCPLLWAQPHSCGLHSLGEPLFSLVDPAEVGLLLSCCVWHAMV